MAAQPTSLGLAPSNVTSDLHGFSGRQILSWIDAVECSSELNACLDQQNCFSRRGGANLADKLRILLQTIAAIPDAAELIESHCYHRNLLICSAIWWLVCVRF